MTRAAHSFALPGDTLGDGMAPLRARVDELHQALITAEAQAHVTAHDLRTPLNTLTGLLHLMTLKFASDLPEPAREYLDYMGRAVQQLDDLSGTFLETARASATLVREQVDMRAVVDAAISEITCETKDLNAIWDVRGSTWCQMADPELLRLLVLLLLRRAAKTRHPSRPPRVVIALADSANGVRALRINDNGTGFEGACSKTVFLPQRDGAHEDNGLAVCHSICTRHGWSITAQSDGVTGAGFDIAFNGP